MSENKAVTDIIARLYEDMASSPVDDLTIITRAQLETLEAALLPPGEETATPDAPSAVCGGPQALADVAAERRRHIETEGWDATHDDEHKDGSLALAAGSYCESAARPKLLARKPGCAFAIPKLWPLSWSRDWWKPKSPREDLVRAGALIIAEIERLDRAALSEKQQ
jgi:hypothetical protein